MVMAKETANGDEAKTAAVVVVVVADGMLEKEETRATRRGMRVSLSSRSPWLLERRTGRQESLEGGGEEIGKQREKKYVKDH